MPVARLMTLVGLLQSRGRMSTTELAAEPEVSPRTVLRDLEALSTAGIRSTPPAGREDWREAWIRMGAADTALLDLLALGPEAEVLRPPELRQAMAGAVHRLASWYPVPDDPAVGAG